MVAHRKTPSALTQQRHSSLKPVALAGAVVANDIEQRKKDHIEIILSGQAQHLAPAGFDDIRFEHNALPEVNFDNIDLSTEFLGKKLKVPFLASSMTGGPQLGGRINLSIAEAAQELGFAMGVGSQRIALGGGVHHGLDRSIRGVAPDIVLYANLGAVQFAHGLTVDDARRAVDLIEADALILHLNPLQEALQPGGDRNWMGVSEAIAQLCQSLDIPVIAKEVGAGISPAVALRLADFGVAAIDVAGAGGSSWAAVEGKRTTSSGGQRLGELFRDWGIPTARALEAVRTALPAMPLIASGGIRHGLDGAKAIRLGADLVGQAATLLPAATRSTEEVIAHVREWCEALRIACFATGSADLNELRRAPIA